MSDNTTTPYQLIGTEASLYSGKVRGYLRYKKIPYTEVLSTLDVYRKVIIPRVGKQIIPVLLTPEDECIQDTTCIIDHLETRYPAHAVYPDTPKQKLVSLLLEGYGDEWLVMPAMHYRWGFKRHNLRFVLKEFGQTAMPKLPGFMHYLVGAVPALSFGNLYKAYFGVTKPMEKAIEKSYEGLLYDLNTHFKQHPYLLGDRPCIGDYGLLGPFYAHLYRDPYPGRIMKQQAPYVAKWVERMEFLEDARYGEFLPNDEIPATLIPILKRMTQEQFPVLEATAAELDKWVEKNPNQPYVNRVIGRHSFQIEGVNATRSITPFSYWMFQRALAVFNDSGKQQDTMKKLLTDIGGICAFSHQARCKLRYENYRLIR